MSAAVISRGGDFQDIDFGFGLSAHSSSIQGTKGEWIDNPLIDVLEKHQEEIWRWIQEDVGGW